ncbi:MBL fold metallo-hydrolase [Leucobacter allii]|uniref:MBL fold metallo-hydrolase n=1 Tax=Leucobacter allii TaxID=2932247 RepID=A0ABY4FKT8_9MICO|nr:MBL fold metallo-hydrolase [Leucobacter allii]UOQ56881.1 MBL fold metallo-hydrolase [Leucobacter allii]
MCTIAHHAATAADATMGTAAAKPGVSRRRMLQTAGLGVLAGGAAVALAGCAPAAAPVSAAAAPVPVGTRSKLVLLGTTGGPGIVADRAGICSAVVVDGAVYLVDLGHGAPSQIVKAGLASAEDSATNASLAALRGIFITHMHSDHIAELPALQITGMWNGLKDPASPVQVYGPGNRGGLSPLAGAADPAVIAPDNPTAGTVDMLALINRAFAADLNERIRSSGGVDPLAVLQGHDIALPSGVASPIDAELMPDIDPFDVYEDELVKVTATLVNHAPVFPSFGFRFDTADGSVTFSGDTGPSANLARLAQGTDILVHEVIDREWVESIYPEPRTDAAAATVAHLLNSHTSIEEVGRIATEAGAKHVVLNHMAPATHPEEKWLEVRDHFDGEVTVGTDLAEFAIGS